MSWNNNWDEDELSVLERWKMHYEWEISTLKKDLDQIIQESLVNLRRPIAWTYWGIRSRWTLMETVALMTNHGVREISYVRWRMVENHLENNEYTNYRNCEKLLNLLDEDAVLKIIDSFSLPTNPYAIDVCFKPLDVLTWARLRDIDFPKELEEAIKQPTKPTDWESKYNEAQEEIEKLKNTLLIAPQRLNYECSDVNKSTHKNSEEEDFLSKKQASVYDKIIASLAILTFPVLDDLNGSHIESLTEKNIKKFTHRFKPLDRRTLTRYLKTPRKLLQLEATAQKKTLL